MEIDRICFRRPGGGAEPVVARGQWLEVFARLRAVRDVEACNAGIAIHDRTNRLVFARGWLNADLPPLALRSGEVAVARFLLKLDLEPDEYVVGLACTQALTDPRSPTGWNQDVGGTRFTELPRAAVIAVVPAADRCRESFGPANLRTQLDRLVIRNPTPARKAE